MPQAKKRMEKVFLRHASKIEDRLRFFPDYVDCHKSAEKKTTVAISRLLLFFFPQKSENCEEKLDNRDFQHQIASKNNFRKKENGRLQNNFENAVGLVHRLGGNFRGRRFSAGDRYVDQVEASIADTKDRNAHPIQPQTAQHRPSLSPVFWVQRIPQVQIPPLSNSMSC